MTRKDCEEKGKDLEITGGLVDVEWRSDPQGTEERV
jgi:hypothetical protein